MGSRPTVTRRDLLAAAVVGLVAACTRRRVPSPLPSVAPTPPVDPDAASIRRWLALEERLVASYAGHPELAAFRAHHRAHAAALRALLGEQPPDLAASPRPPRSTVADLLRIETAAARGYRAAVAAVAPERRVLVAELAASEAQHVAILELRRG